MVRAVGSIWMILGALGAAAFAAEWAVVANVNDATLSTIRLDADPPAVHGPFFTQQELGTPNDGVPASVNFLADLRVTPDGRWALVDHFGDNQVSRIDLFDPAAPLLSGTLLAGTSLQDLAIAPNGEFALLRNLGVIDLVVVGIDPFVELASQEVATPGETAGIDVVAIAPDSVTAVLGTCDVGQTTEGFVLYGPIDPAVGLTSTNWFSVGDACPYDIEIGSDGTVLVGKSDDSVAVFRVSAPGVIVPGIDPELTGLPGLQNAIVFSPDGTRAYVYSGGTDPHRLSIVAIHAAGDAELLQAGAVELGPDLGTGLLGMDVLALTGDGSRLIAGNINGRSLPSHGSLTLVDLATLDAEAVPAGTDYPGPLGTVQRLSAREIPTLSGAGAAAALLAFALAGLARLRRTR